METSKLLGEVEVDIVIERRTKNKLKVQRLDLEEDTGVEVLIIIIIMATTSLEVQEVVETIEEVKENKKIKIRLMLIIVLMMQILKTMLIILHRKNSILLSER